MMLVMVTFVGLLIFIYSVGYMAHDENFTRFFCFLSLFAAAMLGLVIANSLLLLFMCWELVGSCLLPADRILVSQTQRGGGGQEGVYHHADWRHGLSAGHGLALCARPARCCSTIRAHGCLEAAALSRLAATNHRPSAWQSRTGIALADLLRGHGEVRPGSASCLAAGRDGRPHAR